MSQCRGRIGRRAPPKSAAKAAGAAMLARSSAVEPARRPNVVFILADQWRGQATGYAGDANAATPALDGLARESVNLTLAVSGCPVCCPYRASLMTGQYPLRHGVVVNDVPLIDHGSSLARAFARGGYDTAYIGKWHLFGSPDGRCGRRSAYVPRESRLGFDTWQAFECSHDYSHSHYFEDDDRAVRCWDGYDAMSQSQAARRYIEDRSPDSRPYLLVVAWGPPHDPYETAPPEYRARFSPSSIRLRPNVPEGHADAARQSLAGYYAHIAALDDCLKLILDAVERVGAADNTLVLFTSDHGDMHGSQGLLRKGTPWDESIRVPFLIRPPSLLGTRPRELALPIDAPDIMPTLLGLCRLPVPASVQGMDLSPIVRGERSAGQENAALINVPIAFGMMREQGLPEHRGLRTTRYTYVRGPDGPWLLYDNAADPFQMRNLCGRAELRTLQSDLDEMLRARLAALGDEFLPGTEYARQLGVDHYDEVRVTAGIYRNPWPYAGDRQ